MGRPVRVDRADVPPVAGQPVLDRPARADQPGQQGVAEVGQRAVLDGGLAQLRGDLVQRVQRRRRAKTKTSFATRSEAGSSGLYA